jgi:hypothetical protein
MSTTILSARSHVALPTRLALIATAVIGLGFLAVANPNVASANHRVYWVDDLTYGSLGQGFYWDHTSNLVWTAERGWHQWSPKPAKPAHVYWVDDHDYGSAGGGFYWDPGSGQVWTSERGWHHFDPRPQSNPDTDGDGLADFKDACPRDKGPAANNGCPYADKDGDGVADPLDACPTVAGPASNAGCPQSDKDGDGILDHLDRCPTVYGPSTYDGCPDIDSDGVPDPDDKCPTLPGLKNNDGCPIDRDGDGVVDYLDGCPTVPGPKENGGCPWVDYDGDGIPDYLDNCPHQKGSQYNHGCPGIPDVDIWVDKGNGANYKVNSNITICWSLNIPWYIKILNIHADGGSHVLIEGYDQEPTGGCIHGTVGYPLGKERVIIYATYETWDAYGYKHTVTVSDEAYFFVVP